MSKVNDIYNQVTLELLSNPNGTRMDIVLEFAKRIAELSFNASVTYWNYEQFGKIPNPHPDKETFINKLFNNE